jgi:hypothetical protein
MNREGVNMTTVIGVTGTRDIPNGLRAVVRLALAEVLVDVPNPHLHVGDAAGVDEMALEVASCYVEDVTVYKPSDSRLSEAAPLAARLQDRSKMLVEALQAAGGTLHAWPNKLCPESLTRDRWHGSGTWGTAYYAWTCGVPVVIHPELMPAGYALPIWLNQDQLTIA